MSIAYADGHLRNLFCCGMDRAKLPGARAHDCGVVCIAAAIAGATSQDLKTGYLVGATPFWQQMGLLIGVTVSTMAIGTTLKLDEQGPGKNIFPTQIPVTVESSALRRKSGARQLHLSRQNYQLINSLGSHEVPDGEYLYSPQTHQIEYQWAQGIGSLKAPAPQARLMATVISGILNQRLPWRLVLMGVALVIAGNSRGTLAGLRHRFVSSARHHRRHVAGGLIRSLVDATTKEKRRRRSQPRRTLLQRTHRRRRCLRPPRHHH